ncbi:MAG: hypothetical protein HW383_598 [Candidatus Magasanikbacteria bacterium]|nr:hypothetical protein [Candidatus Magasanikbacteria bacterium]
MKKMNKSSTTAKFLVKLKKNVPQTFDVITDVKKTFDQALLGNHSLFYHPFGNGITSGQGITGDIGSSLAKIFSQK